MLLMDSQSMRYLGRLSFADTSRKSAAAASSDRAGVATISSPLKSSARAGS
jgi:hypothetical protein